MHHVIEASVFVHACIPRIAIRSTTTSGEDSPVQSIMRMHVYAAYAAIYIYIYSALYFRLAGLPQITFGDYRMVISMFRRRAVQ